ncbi:hypothetical protein DAPPUDRAFT_120140 [Daphnia pulex]|uniref:RING-type E3 ubiquitin transferase n=1 Tax=Daphnia pulex TaxID=6669 RepID=E9I0F0_DAPPU|nr:hypothetical protein DAPPUDRAFT_120140 [Daphnia pulex]|eukprot:EFX62528.1 hypothetical protein DAPPUDRAFT_120140 [Daphnia pulex]
MTHRLIPWLNRELFVLLVNDDYQLPNLLEKIMKMVTKYHICSQDFREGILCEIGGNTDHFIHEFYQFARLPYDMDGFDGNSNYDSRINLPSHSGGNLISKDKDDVHSRRIEFHHRRPTLKLH